VPQVKIKSPVKSPKAPLSVKIPAPHPSLGDACELIGQMLDYETTARSSGADLNSGRFSMLTASERQILRAELVADYIRLSAGNMGNTPGYFDASLKDFCSKICDMDIPSHELIGTYLAALDVVSKGEYLSKIPKLGDAARRTMIIVLRSCVDLLKARVEKKEHAEAAR